jgi:hypothetical protein
MNCSIQVEPHRLPTAEKLHDIWRAWAAEAESLVSRAEMVGGDDIAGLPALRDEIGRIESMLDISPQLISHRFQQVKRGEVRPLEKVRRELRTGYRG